MHPLSYLIPLFNQFLSSFKGQLLFKLFLRQTQTIHPMFNWSNFDILRLLQQQPGRLKSFLLEVPLNDLQEAVEQKQLNADLRFRNTRQQSAYKKNVLDMNLDEVIRLCYQENLINFFGRNLAYEKTRIQNHPIYGRKLVDRFPEKYYVGERSAHFNRARQIEEAYGIFRRRNHDENSSNQVNESQQGDNHSQNNESEQEQQGQNDDNDQNQDIPNNEENGQPSESQSNEDDFIVDDSEIEEDSFIEDSVQEKIKNRKKANRNKKQYQSEEKVQRTQIKEEKSEKTTEKKLKKPAVQSNQEIQLDNYIIKPQQLDLIHQIQIERSKRNQKKIKQQLKKIQTSFSTKPSNSTELIPEHDIESFVVTRKTVKKMELQLD